MNPRKNVIKDEQPRRPEAKARTTGTHLARLRARRKKGKPIVTPRREPTPEDALESVKRQLQLYLAHALTAEANAEHAVGATQIGQLVGYARGSEATVVRLLGGRGYMRRVLWREVQGRVRDLLVRGALKRLADCL